MVDNTFINVEIFQKNFSCFQIKVIKVKDCIEFKIHTKRENNEKVYLNNFTLEELNKKFDNTLNIKNIFEYLKSQIILRSIFLQQQKSNQIAIKFDNSFKKEITFSLELSKKPNPLKKEEVKEEEKIMLVLDPITDTNIGEFIEKKGLGIVYNKEGNRYIRRGIVLYYSKKIKSALLLTNSKNYINIINNKISEYIIEYNSKLENCAFGTYSKNVDSKMTDNKYGYFIIYKENEKEYGYYYKENLFKITYKKNNFKGEIGDIYLSIKPENKIMHHYPKKLEHLLKKYHTIIKYLISGLKYYCIIKGSRYEYIMYGKKKEYAILKKLTEKSNVLDVYYRLRYKLSQLEFEKIKGQGGFGNVYEVIQRNRSSNYSEHFARKYLKTINDNLRKNDNFKRVSFLIKELDIIADIPKSNNIIYLTQWDIMENNFDINFAYGGDLSNLLFDSKILLPYNFKIYLLYSISEGLKVLHENLKIIHGDLKPENVLLNKKYIKNSKLIDFPIPKISDFGLSQTRKNIVEGYTLGYAAPEVIFKNQNTQKSDIFSLGLLFYVILKQYYPYSKNGKSTIKTKREKLKDLPNISNEKWGDDNCITELIKQCCNFEPDKRPNISKICDILTQEIKKIFGEKGYEYITNQFEEEQKKLARNSLFDKILRNEIKKANIQYFIGDNEIDNSKIIINDNNSESNDIININDASQIMKGKVIKQYQENYKIIQFPNGDILEGIFPDNGNQISGFAILKNKIGDVYKGNLKNGKFEGIVKLSFKRGDVFVGEYENGLKNGYGFYAFPERDGINNKYEGYYKDDLREGIGICNFMRGNIYEGQFEKGMRNGIGTSHLLNGNYYQGEYKDGIKNGYGFFIYVEGNRFEGQFNYFKNGFGVYTYLDLSEYDKFKFCCNDELKNNENIIPRYDQYIGNFRNDKHQGFGIFKTKYGQILYKHIGNFQMVANGIGKCIIENIQTNTKIIIEGEFDFNEISGYARISIDNEIEIEAFFTNTKIDGYCTIKKKNGNMIKIITSGYLFKIKSINFLNENESFNSDIDNLINGYGEEYLPNGALLYSGMFKNGKYNGYGEYYDNDNKIIGEFQEGKVIFELKN